MSFNLFDRYLPQNTLKESNLGSMSKLVNRLWVMFILGAALTMLSISVSVSLGLLVPLNHRDFIHRKNIIPNIVGANITTFADTILMTMPERYSKLFPFYM